MTGERDPKPEYRGLRVAGMLATIGLTLALSIGIGVGMGILLDRWLKTKGLLVIVFTLFGVIAGFKQLIQTVIRANREQEAADAEERRERQR